MKKLHLLFITTMLMTGFTKAAHLNGQLIFSSSLTAQQSIPPITTSAKGFALLRFNTAMDTLFIDASYTGLSSAVTGVHIHQGSAGISGSVLVDLSAGVKAGGFMASISGSALASVKTDLLMNGGYYLNVHTTINPNGEIRGQIMLDQNVTATAWLNGSNEVPASGSMANGIASVTLSKDMKWADIKVIANGLSGSIAGAHIHKAMAGSNGGVVLDLSDSVNGNLIAGRFDVSSLIDDLKSGMLYINIHTANYASGEIRGQLNISPKLNFYALLNGKQEVPMVNTTAMGWANFAVNAQMDSLWVDILADGLSGQIDGIHIHDGKTGTNGGVLADLTAMVSGNKIQGTISGKTTVMALLPKLLTGGAYVNIHTMMNMNGEIRGQIMPLNSRLFQFNLDGKQEVPAVNTMAKGKAYISLSADLKELYIECNGMGVESKITGAHIHQAKAGMNGGVLLDLSNVIVQSKTEFNGSGTFYMGKDYDTVLIMALLKYETYINIHTEDNPNGELRGQNEEPVMSQSQTSANAPYIELIQAVIYPNPASDILNINLPDNKQATCVLSTTDGKIWLNEKFDGTYNNTINISSLPAGLYFLNITSNNGSYTRRIEIVR